ncbi:MAG TPA: multidrug ABC transporter ATP-binding protein [Anaerolineaceae bacterium]|nr:multidrug ABC transporter ATP-binding protein [Anaerolineaceae bacterium]
MPEIIKVQNLIKTYKGITAVDDISFDVHEGEIFGMVGPNGAGKTTTIECIEGLRKPDSGTIRVLNLDPQADNKMLRTRVGMQLQQSNLPDRMKVWEALDLYSAFYETPVDWKNLLKQLGLEEKRDARFGKLSGGQKQRLFIALALLPNPNLVFLDELTTGLDPQARHTIWDLVRSVRDQGKTIYLTTHFMEEAERLCDRVAILDHGKIVALDTPRALIGKLAQHERVSFTLDVSITQEIQNALSVLGKLEVQGDRLTVIGKSTDATQLVTGLVNILSGLALRYSDLRTEQPTLEDVFLDLTGRKIRE